ncbi:MAG: hypothetical protein JWQ33_1455 [Ramlibacter sp.]|nr:hypothetical protein [Ramlibacter sp.]
MRALFSVLSLLIVVVVIGLLAKKQMGSMAGPPVLPTPAGAAPSAAAGPMTPQQTVQQFQQAVESQMQQARPMPDDPK